MKTELYPDDPFPKPKSPQYQVLTALLAGTAIDVGMAFMEWNMPSLSARVSELRRLGWPVRTDRSPHPKLPGEFITIYFMDRRFRDWMLGEGKGQHPKDYPDQDGRIHPQKERA